MPTWPVKFEPTHLSVFVIDRTSERPIARLPVYAQVIWTEPPSVPPDNRFAELVTPHITEADPECGGSGECRTRVRTALALAPSDASPKALVTTSYSTSRPHMLS